MRVGSIELAGEVSTAVRAYIADDNWEVIHKKNVMGLDGAAYRFPVSKDMTVFVGEERTAVSWMSGCRRYDAFIDTPRNLYRDVEHAIEQRRLNKDEWVKARMASYLSSLRRI